MILQFTKMHGCGNDFIVIDGIHQDLSQINTAQWQFLADRHFGIGADQILLVENSCFGCGRDFPNFAKYRPLAGKFQFPCLFREKK